MKTLVLIALFCGFIYTVQGGVPVGLYLIQIHDLKKINSCFYFSLAIAISVLMKRFEKTTAPIVPETLLKPLLIAKYAFLKITILNTYLSTFHNFGLIFARQCTVCLNG